MTPVRKCGAKSPKITDKHLYPVKSVKCDQEYLVTSWVNVKDVDLDG